MITFIKYLFGIPAALFILFVIIGLSGGWDKLGEGHSRVQTKYAQCKEAASHMRSDRETEEVMRGLCDRLPVENADMRY